MKKLLIALASFVFIFPLFLTACTNPGPTVTRQFSNSGFSNVQVGSAFEVEITPSDTYSVSITAPENLFDKIKIEQSGLSLNFSIDWGWGFWNNWGSRPKLEITMPEIDVLDISGATKATAKGFQSSNDFKLEVSGASTADIDVEAYDTSVTVSGASTLKGKLAVHDLRLNVSGASNSNLSGSVNNLNLQVSGASSTTLNSLTARDARVELSGASHASINSNGDLDVFLSGASNLEYTGSPTLGIVEVSGGSSLHQK